MIIDARNLTEDEHFALVAKFKKGIKHPAGSDLIYYPENVGLSADATMEDIVDLAFQGEEEGINNFSDDDDCDYDCDDCDDENCDCYGCTDDCASCLEKSQWLQQYENVKHLLMPQSDLNAYFNSTEIDKMKLRTFSIGKVNFPTGKIICRSLRAKPPKHDCANCNTPCKNKDQHEIDTYVYRPYWQEVPAGAYELKLCSFDDSTDRTSYYAAAMLEFSDQEPVAYYNALCGDEPLKNIRRNIHYGVSVVDSSGLISIMDVETQATFEEFKEQYENKKTKHTGRYILIAKIFDGWTVLYERGAMIINNYEIETVIDMTAGDDELIAWLEGANIHNQDLIQILQLLSNRHMLPAGASMVDFIGKSIALYDHYPHRSISLKNGPTWLDEEAARSQRLGNIYDDFFAPMFQNAAFYKEKYDKNDWLNWTIPNSDLTVPMIRLNNGHYPAYFGYDADGKVCRLVIHFINLEGSMHSPTSASAGDVRWLISILGSMAVDDTLSLLNFRPKEGFVHLSEGEFHEMEAYFDEYSIYKDLIPIMTDKQSNYICVYISGTLKGMVCLLEHDEPSLEPKFLNISNCVEVLKYDPHLESGDFDFPRNFEGVENIIAQLFTDLEAEKDDDRRLQLALSILELALPEDTQSKAAAEAVLKELE
jgi:hypothetical protein